MNSKMLLDALGDISDEYVMGAQKYLTNDVLKITNSKAHQRTVPQKLLILAATIAAVMSLLVTAMAVNEDFREKVFEFFHISTSENVPNGGDLATSGLDTVIGERVSARYLDFAEDMEFAGNGILYQRECDANGNLENVLFYEIGKDGLSALKTSSVQFELKDDELAGNGRIFWCKSENGAMAIGNGQMLDGQRSWNVSTIAGQPDKALFSVYGGILSKFDFSVFLLDLPTGTLHRLNIPTLYHVQEIQLTSNLNYALIWGQTADSQQSQPYVCNLQSGEMFPLIPMANANSRDFATHLVDDDAVILTMQKENCFSAWSCDVKTGSVTETANNLSIRTQDGKTAGLVDVGTRYALWVNADQSVAVLDLKTGYQSSAIAGFSFDGRAIMLPNISGTSICYYIPTQDQDTLAVKTLGVMNFEKAQFSVFDRSGFDKNKEWRLGWLNENQVCISAVGDSDSLFIYTFS